VTRAATWLVDAPIWQVDAVISEIREPTWLVDALVCHVGTAISETRGAVWQVDASACEVDARLGETRAAIWLVDASIRETRAPERIVGYLVGCAQTDATLRPAATSATRPGRSPTMLPRQMQQVI
jgi:hypothetical protein